MGTPLRIDDEYVTRFAGSRRLFDEAVKLIPGGITHDTRHFDPFPIYVDHALGSHKWDVDGHDLIDIWMGHGSLILGHSHPAVVAAVQKQMARGTHLGACHEMEVEWARLVQRIVPSAEKVRFVASGTEATMLAMRLARAFTGRPKILKLKGHFHGWNDYAAVGTRPPFEAPISAGVPEAVLGTVVAVAPNDLAAAEQALKAGDIAAIILEPGGGSSGRVPVLPGYLAGLRALATQYKAVLIFDEVITGFRVAPGGVQQIAGVIPDMTTLGKIVAGGMPGGAIVGRADVMDMLGWGDAHWNRYRRALQQGTFNASPVVAAAALTALPIVEKGEVQRQANHVGEVLRTGMNRVLREQKAPGLVYGSYSILRIFLGKNAPPAGDVDGVDATWPPEKLMGGMGALGPKLRKALLINGVDTPADGGWLSAVHSPADCDGIIDAFAGAVARLKAEGEL